VIDVNSPDRKALVRDYIAASQAMNEAATALWAFHRELRDTLDTLDARLAELEAEYERREAAWREINDVFIAEAQAGGEPSRCRCGAALRPPEQGEVTDSKRYAMIVFAQTAEARLVEDPNWEDTGAGERDEAHRICQWRDGNFSCDCNRALQFHGGEPEPNRDGEPGCSEGRYAVALFDDAGAELWSDVGTATPLRLSTWTDSAGRFAWEAKTT
jgi:hypothetical protein